MTLARLFDDPEFRYAVVQAIRPRLGSAKRVGFPAVLGLHHPGAVHRDLEASLGVPVFEIPGLPPSIPGIRLHKLLVNAIQAVGGQVFSGSQVIASEVITERVIRVISEAAARKKSEHAHHFILATGGFLGGGLIAQETGYAQETVFNLPIHIPPDRSGWTDPRFFKPGGQPIFQAGVRVSNQFRPLDMRGQPLLNNVSVIGGALCGYDPLRERSQEGVALATAFWAVRQIEEGYHE
jgi:glycerol-3-phosphate dehydrogenase subunit B